MSNFECEKCGAICQDSPIGYVTGCEHYPSDVACPQEPLVSMPVKKRVMVKIVKDPCSCDAWDGLKLGETVGGSTPYNKTSQGDLP